MSLRKITTLTILSSLLLLPINIESSFAVSLPFRLAWERNSETDLAFYTVYYGTSSANYSHSADVDKQYPSFSFHEDLLARNGLSVGPDGLTLYIALTATDYSLNESGYSTELVTFIEYSTVTTTTPASIPSPPSTAPNQQEFCSNDSPLILKGDIPQE